MLKIFFDLDDVLVDFAGGALATHGQPAWYDENPDCRGGEFWDLPECLGMTKEEFWEPLETHDWWSNLKALGDGMAMFQHAFMSDDTSCSILTTPWPCCGCYSGKFEWFMRWIHPSLPVQNFIPVHDKHVYAQRAILVDDNETNCRNWREFGGYAFLVGRKRNRRHFMEDHNLSLFKEFMGEIREFQT